MHALVFAAGRGTRLRPYTDATPKPMLEIDDKPLLERTLRTVVDDGNSGAFELRTPSSHSVTGTGRSASNWRDGT